VAQSDGLVCLIILSADGHPKGARGHAPARSQQLPTATAVSQKKIFASCLRLFSQGNLAVENKKDTAYFFKIRKLTGFSGVFFFFFFRNKAVAARFGF